MRFVGRPTSGSRARVHRALRRRKDVFRPQRSQTSKIARLADPLIARPARQARHLHRLGRNARVAPRRRPRGFCRSIYSHYRRRRGRGDVQRPGVAADEQPAALDQRPQLRQVELAEIDDPIGRRPPAPAAPPPRSAPPPRGRTAPSSARSAAAAMPARALRPSAANAGSGQRRNGLPALTCTTISSCSGRDAGRVAAAARSARRPPRRPPSRPRRAPGPAPPRGQPVDRLQQVPLVHDRVPRPQRPRPRARLACTSSVRPGDVVADALRRPGQPASATRCAARRADRSRGRNAPRRSRRASRRSRHDPRQPGACGATITSSRCGLPLTTGAAAGSTRYVSVRVRKRPLQRPRGSAS